MDDFTLAEACWLWLRADDNYAPPIAQKLRAIIDIKSPRQLSDTEIRELAHGWRSDFENANVRKQE